MLRTICDKYDVTLIFDETITGFCKTGEMFAAQSYGVTPDIIVCGKGISNGTMPLSAMIADEKMAQVFQDKSNPDTMFAHGQTFAGQPLSAAVGLAVLNELTSRDLHQTASVNGELLRGHLADINDELGCFREVRGKGCLLAAELENPDSPTDPKTGQRVAWKALGAALKKTSLDNGWCNRLPFFFLSELGCVLFCVSFRTRICAPPPPTPLYYVYVCVGGGGYALFPVCS